MGTSTSTTTSTTITTTTTEACDKAAGELCADNVHNLSWTCCSPYSCSSITNQSSICKGTNLALGDTCFSATQGSLGDCASPNICLDNVCTAPDSTCIQPVNGLCFQKDTSSSLGSCCTGSICTPLISDPTSDYFCQKILELGEDCNPDERRGFCKDGGFCIDSICTAGSETTTTTTTTTSTTTTSTTTTVTTPCVAADTTCLSFSAGAVGDCCTGQCEVFEAGVGFKCNP